MNCSASGFPVPSLTWFHNDTLIQQTNQVSIQTDVLDSITNLADDFGVITSILTVSGADVNDTGLYRCDANSIIDTYLTIMSNEALVLVQGNCFNDALINPIKKDLFFI